MKILIAGYYGFGNLGDELILSAVISHLNGRYKAPEITVLSVDPADTIRTHQVRAISRWNLWNVFKEIWRNDFLVLGGGGLLQNKTSQRSLLYYLGLVAMARAVHCPVVLYAMGVETLEGGWARKLTWFLLSGPRVIITVRDEASKQILSEIGVPPKRVHVTADPVFTRTPSSGPRERYAGGAATALLIPRFPCPPQGRTMFAILARILRDEKKMQVSGALFQPILEMAHLKSYTGEQILPEGDFALDFSIDDMVERVAAHDWVISARFHGLVLAALAGRPFIGIGDPHKVGRLCDMLKMPFLPWGSSENAIQAAVHKLALKTLASPAVQIERLRDAALQTANHV